MRRLLACTALGLCLLAGSPARATDLKGTPVGKPVPINPGVLPVEEKAPTCGKHGTTIDFVSTPSEAATLAKKDGKLVFVLHVSGLFEDPTLT